VREEWAPVGSTWAHGTSRIVVHRAQPARLMASVRSADHSLVGDTVNSSGGYQAAWGRVDCWLVAVCSCWLMRWSSAVRSPAVNFQLNGRAVRL
jgi:hypothetical protein